VNAFAACSTSNKLQTQEDRREERVLQCQTLVNLQWEEIDVAPLIERIAAIEKQFQEIRQGNQALQKITRKSKKCEAGLKSGR
jgi:hypothetical protein